VLESCKKLNPDNPGPVEYPGTSDICFESAEVFIENVTTDPEVGFGNQTTPASVGFGSKKMVTVVEPATKHSVREWFDEDGAF
jgi:hypothetical protein